MLSMFLLGLPILASGLLFLVKERWVPHLLAGVSATLLLGLLVLGPQSSQYSWGWLSLRTDGLSWIFSLLGAFIWLAASLYGLSYLSHVGGLRKLGVFWLLALTCLMGFFWAGSWPTMLFFFEGLTLTSAFWVFHGRTLIAWRAGRLYLYMGVFGGLLLTAGAFMLSMAPGGSPTISFIAGILMILGFGVKAGMLPVHIWLPEAHPVAPTIASALLSGVLIKAGSYGIFRLLLEVLPGEVGSQLGFFLIFVGALTMLLGVFNALIQEEAKRMLAYHSISQMGYIVMGIGIAAFYTGHGGSGALGALLHMINHALYKALLFLGVGVLVLRTQRGNLYKWGGLARPLPVTAGMLGLAALAIAGLPGLNGYLSKSILHHSIADLAAHQSLFNWVEKAFVITGIGTAASFAKLLLLAFKARPDQELEVNEGESTPMLLGMGLLCLPILGIGLFPRQILGAIIPYIPVVDSHLPDLAHTHFFGAHEIMGILPTLAFGSVVAIWGLRYHLFHLHAPRWLSLQWWGLQGRERLVSWVASGQGRWNTIWQWAQVHLDQGLQRGGELLVALDQGGGGRYSLSNLNLDLALVIALLVLVLLLGEMEVLARIF